MKRETATRRKLHSGLLLALLWVILSSGGCLSEREPVQKSNTDLGRILYDKHCAACHQPDGSGAQGGGPPLVDSAWVSGPESRLIRIILHGVGGSIEVSGDTYDREMLGFGQVLTDHQIATLLTFVRSRWGDIDRPVREENVGRIRHNTLDRTAYWTVDELLQIP